MDLSTRIRSLVWLTLAALVFLALAPAEAEIYKWTDAKGVLHFSDKPPPQDQVELVRVPATNSFRAAPVAEPSVARAESRRPAKAKSVVMFSAEWCGYCRKARRFFQANGVAFRERDIEKEPAARREYERLGGAGVPLILVGDRRLTGFSEAGFRRLYGN
jgi:glutaredoxin